MKRRFEYKDAKSDKYWEIELNGKSYTTWYGRTGSKPRSDVNSFSSDTEAQKEYDRLVREKVRKGYKEVTVISEVNVTQAAYNQKDNQVNNTFKIIKEFSPWADEIKSTVKTFVKIELNGKPKNLWSSKVGSVPYLPLNYEYPVKGKLPLLFLAQINFKEVPALEGFPDKGILQFYIGDDDLYGLNLKDHCKSNFRVLYFPDVIEDKTKLINDFSFLKKLRNSPLDEGFTAAMKFTLDMEVVPPFDFRFEKLLPQLCVVMNDDDDLSDLYYEEVADSSGHKIGGYPMFTQEDPRGYKPLKGMGYELLFQLDVDKHLMFGDSGVCNFFILPDDLKLLDFTRVLYNWDCC